MGIKCLLSTILDLVKLDIGGAKLAIYGIIPVVLVAHCLKNPPFALEPIFPRISR